MSATTPEITDAELGELLPCPFCSAEARHYHRPDEEGWSNTDWVCCQNDDCGCGTCMHETRELAIAAWNRRAEAQASAPSEADEWQFDLSTAPLWDGAGMPPYVLVWNGHHRGVGYRQAPNYDDDPEWTDESGEFIEPPVIAWRPLPAPPHALSEQPE